MELKVLAISEAPKRTDNQVIVKILDTGKELKLPLSQVEFAPGRVVIPAWLYNQIFGKDKK